MLGLLPRIQIKTASQLRTMRAAGLVVSEALTEAALAAVPGVTTAELDEVAADVIASHGAAASFLGYLGFPATVCISVNNEVIHGIPGQRSLRAGDLVSIDCGAIVDGWHGDAALSVIVPASGEEPEPTELLHRPDPIVVAPAVAGLWSHADLSSATRRALWAGIDQAHPGARLTDIGDAIQRSLSEDFGGVAGIVRDYVGHGIGDEMHMRPDVPNVGPSGRGPRLRAGMVLAIEPMVSLGSGEVEELSDDWTVVTVDGSVAAHWEHTVAVTSRGPWVLTEPESDPPH